MEWKGDVLCIEIIDVLNREAVGQFIDCVKQAVADKGSKRWGRLIDLRKWDGFTPDAHETYAAFTDWYTDAGAVAHVQVHSSNFLKTMTGNISARIASKRALLQCESVEAGMDWLCAFDLGTS